MTNDYESLKVYVFELDKRLTVAESDIVGIKDDIKEIKDGMNKIEDNTRNSFRANLTIGAMILVAIVGWIITST